MKKFEGVYDFMVTSLVDTSIRSEDRVSKPQLMIRYPFRVYCSVDGSGSASARYDRAL